MAQVIFRPDLPDVLADGYEYVGYNREMILSLYGYEEKPNVPPIETFFTQWLTRPVGEQWFGVYRNGAKVPQLFYYGLLIGIAISEELDKAPISLNGYMYVPSLFLCGGQTHAPSNVHRLLYYDVTKR